MRWLLDTTVDVRDDEIDNHGKESGENRGKRILGTTILGDLYELGNRPTDEIHPSHGRGEREPTNNRVESLSLELLGDEVNSSKGGGNRGHYV